MFLGFVGFSSCVKDQIPPIENTQPIFGFNGDFDGENIEIKAGLDDYYLFTTYSHDELDVYTFSGEFKRTNSNSHLNNLKINIRASETVESGFSFNIANSLHKGDYGFQEPRVSSTSPGIQFNSSVNGAGSFDYEWDFGDGFTSTNANPIHRYRTTGAYKVTLDISNAQTNCQSSISNDLDIQSKMLTNIDECKADFTYKLIGSNLVEFTSLVPDSLTLDYFWDFGDGTTTTIGQGTKVWTHQYNQSKLYEVTHRITRANCVVAKNKIITTNPTNNQCIANYDYARITDPGNDSLELSKVEVIWTDENGTVFSSKNILQEVNHNFEILAVEDYTPNENQIPTKKIRGIFSCLVADETQNKILELRNIEVSFAVAYPEF